MLGRYDTADYNLAFCKEEARRLRQSGKYSRVRVVKKQPDRGIEYGAIYVERRETTQPIN